MGYGNAGSGWAARDGSAGQWRAAAGARRFCLTRRLAARGDGILARGRRCVAGEPTVAGMPRRPGPRGVPQRARARWRADIARHEL
jgi:hypothetical protein